MLQVVIGCRDTPWWILQRQLSLLLEQLRWICRSSEGNKWIRQELRILQLRNEWNICPQRERIVQQIYFLTFREFQLKEVNLNLKADIWTIEMGLIFGEHWEVNRVVCIHRQDRNQLQARKACTGGSIIWQIQIPLRFKLFLLLVSIRFILYSGKSQGSRDQLII